MNRKQRRANESAARHPSPTMSFEQLVSKAQVDQLKPLIHGLVADETAEAKRQIARMILSENARLQTRLVVLETVLIEKLGETEESLAERILVVEDEATGHSKVDEAQAGDQVRCTFSVRPTGADQFSAPQSVVIHHIATPMNPKVAAQTYVELEQALVGKKTGEEVEVDVPVPMNDTEKAIHTFKVRLDRISRPIKREAAAAPVPEVPPVADTPPAPEAPQETPPEAGANA